MKRKKKHKGRKTGKKKESAVKAGAAFIAREHPEMYGLLLFGLNFLVFLSLISFAYGQHTHNLIGAVGYTIGWIFHSTFGASSYLITFFIGWIALRRLFGKSVNHLQIRALSFAAFITSLCIILNLVQDRFPTLGSSLEEFFYPYDARYNLPYYLGGIPFHFLYNELPRFNLHHVLNTAGILITFLLIMLVAPLIFFRVRLVDLIEWIKRLIPKPKIAPVEVIADTNAEEIKRFVKLKIPSLFSARTKEAEVEVNGEEEENLLAIQPEKEFKLRPSLSRKSKPDDAPPSYFMPGENHEEELPKREKKTSPALKREKALKAQSVHNGDFTHYKLPSPSSLTSPKQFDQSALKNDLKRQAEVLEETLLSFGIEAKVGQINCGPTITSFEVHPSVGVKVQRIKALENDIALNMEATSIRIIAPIPGKAAVGVEVPNPHPQEVSFQEMLNAYKRGPKKFHIPLLLGKAVNGDYVMSDLTKMPHCIIAGATGSGKSVCVNTIVMSILFNAKPDEIRLLMVDPKKVELTPYSNLPHMIAPVITEPQEAYTAMQWLVKEMEKRYDILNRLHCRNIERFNQREIDKEYEESLGFEVPEKMPYIVGIVDELADLMMASSYDIETPIARIAQMARAVGIHLILATQRPSREVITGLIKANFPTRICFKVSSGINSKIVIDTIGGEQLLGNGDMLFLPPGTSHISRLQGSFIRDEDIQRVIQHITEQASPNYQIPTFTNLLEFGEPSIAGGGNSSAKDPLYKQALDIVLSTGNASTTFLQRKLKVGYARAASLMDELEEEGVVSPPDGSKARTVLAGNKEA